MTKKLIKPEIITDVLLSDLVKTYAPTIMKTLNINQVNNGCCCCCNANPTTPAMANNCSVDEFDVQQELRLDPNSFGVAGGPTIIGTQAIIRWSVSAPTGSTVSVQVRTRGLDGNPGGKFDAWTDTQFINQALIDQVQYNFNDFLGTKVEFRIVVLDGNNTILCIGPPDC